MPKPKLRKSASRAGVEPGHFRRRVYRLAAWTTCWTNSYAANGSPIQ